MSAETREAKLAILQEHSEEGYELTMCLALKAGTNEYCRVRTAEDKRCRVHGGAQGSGQKAVGRYGSYFSDETLMETYERFLNDPNLMDLKDEIGLLRTQIAELRGDITSLPAMHTGMTGGVSTPKATYIKLLLDTCDKLGKMIERLRKFESGYFSPETIPAAQAQILTIITNYLDTCPHCGKELLDLRRGLFQALYEVKRVVLPGERKDKDANSG